MYQVLLFIVSRDISPIGSKVPDRKFSWSDDHEFYTKLEFWNSKSMWSTDKFVTKLLLLRKNKSSLEKNSVTEGFFFKRVKIK